jgi:GT2 family glycosyltransferase
LVKVYLAVPTRGQIDTLCSQEHQKFADALGAPIHYERNGISISLCRNMIVQQFLKTDADCLIMVDDDVVPPDTARTLPSRLEEYDIVGAACPIFRPGQFPIPIWNAFKESPDNDGWRLVRPPDTDIAVEVDAVGAGCIAIRRHVLETLPFPTFRDVAQTDGAYGEDFLFCADAKKHGYRIACDYNVRCDHLTKISLGALLNGLARIQRPARPLVRRPADEFGMVVAPT